MNNEKEENFLVGMYRRYNKYVPADLWAYLIMIVIIAIAAIFIL